MSTVQSQLLKLAHATDRATVRQQTFQGASDGVTITGAVDNGSGLIRITAANHGFETTDDVHISAVTGTTEANNTPSNPKWVITRITSSTFDLQGSAFVSAYISGGTAVGALIGSVDGVKFTRQRLLDIYNESRLVAFKALENIYPKSLLKEHTGEISQEFKTLDFLAGVTTNLPSGIMKIESLTDSTGKQILVDVIEASVVRAGANPHYTESATNRFVFRINGKLQTVSGNTNVPDASTYELRYFGLTDFTLTDVTGNVTIETFNDRHHFSLIEISQSLALERSTQEVNALATRLFGGQ